MIGMSFLRHFFIIKISKLDIEVYGMSQIDTSTRHFGKRCPYPISLSLCVLQNLAHGKGELDSSHAAASQRLTMTLSTLSTTSPRCHQRRKWARPSLWHSCSRVPVYIYIAFIT